MKILNNIKESFISAYSSLKVNRLRTFLTLFGITIGIFAIISVFTVIDSLERSIRNSLSALGEDIIYIQKWPWTQPPGEEYAWWEYLKRPVPDIEEFSFIQKNTQTARAVVFSIQSNRTISYQSQSIRDVAVNAYTHELESIRDFKIREGRYFSRLESEKGNNVVILGAKIADELFKGRSPINKRITVSGKKVTVIGVFKKEGQNPIISGGSMDNIVLIPLNYGKRFIDLNKVNPSIILRAKEGVHIEEMVYESKRLMRGIRRLRPAEEDNFSINRASLVSRNIDALFGVINVAGWLIGGFSIIVGGFGIANIMFVSVKERTRIIGIQKAIGAKNYFILSQFLFESVILALIGGFIGLILIFAGSIIASNLTELNIILTTGNVILGLAISGVIGMVSGLAPARSAAKLNPVDAINSTF